MQTRREFLKTLGAAVAGLMLPQGAVKQEQEADAPVTTTFL